MLSIIVSLLYQILVYAISIAYFSAKGDSEPALANPCLELPPCVFSQFSPLSHSRLTENIPKLFLTDALLAFQFHFSVSSRLSYTQD